MAAHAGALRYRPSHDADDPPPHWLSGTALAWAGGGMFVASLVLLASAMALFRPTLAGAPLLSLSDRAPSPVVPLEEAGYVFAGLAVAAGLLAIHRGWRPSGRLLFGIGAAVALFYVFLPPIAGDSDVLDYAIYGRIAFLGHSPYLITPAQFLHSGDPVGAFAPRQFITWPTVYGPIATIMQWSAAWLGGSSMVMIVLWLKLGNAVAFLGTGAGLTWLTRSDPVLRGRAAVLWTVNPLMLFWLVGDGHLDVWLALLAVLALVVFKSRYGSHPAGGFLTGVILGTGIAIKSPFALLVLGFIWAARRSPRVLASGLAGAVAVLVPSYLFPGALDGGTLERRLTWNPGYLHLPAFITSDIAFYAATLLAGAAVLSLLLLWRLPSADAAMPAVRPAVALVLAYLVVFPTEGPWYDALIFPLLALMAAGWLEYLVVAQCVILSLLGGPAVPTSWARQIEHVVGLASHVGLLLVPVALVVMSVRRAWGLDSAGASEETGGAAAPAASQGSLVVQVHRGGRHRLPAHR